ncbi:uncharacterized protein LOC115626043 [Scaptodrosophila lebanonensis]|uniref:Uncharacterized protein LOC115626043 n=1 Tax=Drosophila lebanonensis TaxID=7225 RepID=A0A6J2TM75_DROLE|nr:uncharacterized protein LOC115626043 [Scaptodrosophila lebanonensis]
MDPSLSLEELIRIFKIQNPNRKRSVNYYYNNNYQSNYNYKYGYNNTYRPYIIRERRFYSRTSYQQFQWIDLRYKILAKVRLRSRPRDARHILNYKYRQQGYTDDDFLRPMRSDRPLGGRLVFPSSYSESHRYRDLDDMQDSSQNRSSFWRNFRPTKRRISNEFAIPMIGFSSTPKQTSSGSEAAKPPGYKIMINNLQHSVTSEDIDELFSCFGTLLEACVLRPGTAMVVFKHRSDAERAYEDYDRREFDGKPMQLTASYNSMEIDENVVRRVLFRSD